MDGSQFCPRCGRRSGRLADIAPQSPHLMPDKLEWDLPLRNIGPGALPYRVEVSTPHVEIIGTPSGELMGGKDRAVRLRLRPDAPAQVTAVVTLWARDAARSHWWIKDAEREIRVPITVTRRQSAALYVPAQVLLFADAAPAQCLHMYNQGDEPTAVTMQAPPAFTVSKTRDLPGERVLSINLEGRGSASVWITRTSQIGAERILEVSCGAQKFAVELRPLLPPSRALFKPDYVVGIDFGTSNTSLRLRKVAAPDEDPIVIGEERFPSVLFINPAYPKNAVIGNEARNAWNDPTQPDDVFLVEGIKTLVRLDLEPYKDRHGPEWSVAYLLRLYLGELRKLIAQYLEKENIKDESNILYVFTLPVLDAGEKYARQEKRMRLAASQAGFPDDPDLVWTISEPHAAAQQIAHVLPRYAGMEGFPEGIRPGMRLCVVDAGGGTTDVCLGELKIDEAGLWSFVESKGDALIKAPSPAGSFFQSLFYGDLETTRNDDHADTQFGGNTIDLEMGFRSIPNGSDHPHFIANAWNAIYKQAGFDDIAMVGGRAKRFVTGICKLKEQLCNFDRHKIDLSSDNEGTPELFEYFAPDVREEIQKKEIPETALAGCDPVFDYSKDIAPMIEELWQDAGVGPYLQQLLTEAGGCDIVIPVGGTTLVPTVLKELRKWSGQELAEMPKQERKSAVANGAVWTYDARMERMLPMPLTLHVQAGKQTREKLVLNAYQPLAATSTFNQRYDMGEETLQLSLVAEAAGKPLEIARAEFRASQNGQMRIQTSVAEGRVFRLTVSPTDGDAQTLWEVSL